MDSDYIMLCRRTTVRAAPAPNALVDPCPFAFTGQMEQGDALPSHEKIAAAAKCCRDSVCVAIAALEDAGLLTWVHRLTKIRRREQDLFGHWGSVWQVIRTSNGYRLLDPLDREPGRRVWC